MRLLLFLLAILILPCDSSSPVFHMMYSACKLNKQGDSIQPWHIPFQFWTSPMFHVSVSDCCFLTCIQVSQEAGKVVWYSHVFKNLPQFVVIHTVEGFRIVNEAEVDVFLKFPYFFYDPRVLAIWSLVPLPFLNPTWSPGSSWSTYCWSLAWRILSMSITLLEMSAIVQ